MRAIHLAFVALVAAVPACAAPSLDGVDTASRTSPKDSDDSQGPQELAPGSTSGDTTIDAPSTESPLVAFKGGSSIALRWSVVGGNADGVAHWYVFRDGKKVATVDPGFHADFPEKDGKGYIDRDIQPNGQYEYRVQVVNDDGDATDLGAPLKVTAPSSFSAPPTLRYDIGGRSDATGYFDRVKAFLEIWYPKLTYALAAPDYQPTNAFTLRYDPNGPGWASASHRPDEIVFTAAPLESPNDLGGVFHEATHMVHDAQSTPGWLVEGIADWAREYILHDRDPKPIGPNDDYKDGYSPSSYFLNWMEQTYGKPVVRTAIIATHKAPYSADFFPSVTGEPVLTMWNKLTGRHVPYGPLAFTGMANKCVDGGGPVAETGKAQVATCNGAQSQKWTWAQMNVNSSDGVIYLESDGGCLDVKDKSKEVGALVRSWPCGRHEGQAWKRQVDGTLINPNSGFCLDNPNGSTVDGTNLRTWYCNGSPAQRFTLPQ